MIWEFLLQLICNDYILYLMITMVIKIQFTPVTIIFLLQLNLLTLIANKMKAKHRNAFFFISWNSDIALKFKAFNWRRMQLRRDYATLACWSIGMHEALPEVLPMLRPCSFINTPYQNRFPFFKLFLLSWLS